MDYPPQQTPVAKSVLYRFLVKVVGVCTEQSRFAGCHESVIPIGAERSHDVQALRYSDPQGHPQSLQLLSSLVTKIRAVR